LVWFCFDTQNSGAQIPTIAKQKSLFYSVFIFGVAPISTTKMWRADFFICWQSQQAGQKGKIEVLKLC
jgi:hypothetical protein